ncbi:hypothetical protein [Polymorphospora lycopeni]|uniref:DUF1877 family protein n=1 Tax=Polymorphospora lycopeni TaxID=3140240 RepID=A0ABV5CUD7_9ACTN
MGVLHDYFRAPDAATAIRAMDALGGPLTPDGDGRPAFDGVATKGIDPDVVLGKLVALMREVPWTTDVVGDELVWPAPDAAPRNAEEARAMPPDAPWVTGPWLFELDEPARDTLAELDDDRHSEIAVAWGRTEELADFGPVDPEYLVELVTELTGLARRARENGERLYCWTCL